MHGGALGDARGAVQGGARGAAQGDEQGATQGEAGGEPGVVARLAALGLPDIRAPAAAAGAEAAAAEQLQDAACDACSWAVLAAEALGLPPERVDAVSGGVQAATEEAGGCRRFLGMEYPRLRRACAAGEVGLVRAWMDRIAARGS
ncbi:hypothetical protein MNEG_14420 [Monoraphidium neglectum]|uniref:Uncharacterized protein n=1 Tax=Monoraphidium neglectum TaxID=145388 RepID=A0A0D2J0E7_9CHLO|nr:hypothetical protein MNEG_14420 [Monoraphidium neglectum]KIY93542.1 hypothetical protein MNEG_14420 [Monoraphidium neglectum]|eukprot:XP_013892562.1 hypothetical protein MNEG_14420 [Monoraphidium neglectum]